MKGIDASGAVIEKVKLGKDAVTIVFGDGDTTSLHLTCDEPPRPEFSKALQALLPHALEMCELVDWGERGCEVIGVSMSHTNGQLGVTISFKKMLDNGKCVVVNTPHYAEAGEHQTGAALSAGAAIKVDAVCNEARLYLGGARAQAELDLGGEQNS